MIGYKIICTNKNVEDKFKFRKFFGKDCAIEYVSSLLYYVRVIVENYLSIDTEMEYISFLKQNQLKDCATQDCFICSEKMDVNDKILHHNHFNGLFLGVVYNTCNLKLKIPNFVNVIFHNLNYDLSLFIREINTRRWSNSSCNNQ